MVSCPDATFRYFAGVVAAGVMALTPRAVMTKLLLNQRSRAIEPSVPLSGMALNTRTSAEPPEPQLAENRLKAQTAKTRSKAFNRRSMLVYFSYFSEGPVGE